MLTIFTPTYNRGYILKELYQSLCKQTNQKFKWLIVDDGSTDNTKELVEKWQMENQITITYLYENNLGKSAAHNKAMKYIDTELFTCVDSDDMLDECAVEIVLREWGKIQQNEADIGGILAFRKTRQGEAITHYNASNSQIGCLKEFYDKKIISGDTMLIFLTNYIKKIQFPMFAGEKFIPEAYLYDQFDQAYKLKIVPAYIYICDYLEDGYTKNMSRLIANNPRGYRAYIEQRLRYDTCVKDKLADTIRYLAIMCCIPHEKAIKYAPYKLLALCLYPFGRLFYIKRYKRYEENR